MQECSFLITGSAHGVDVDVIPFCHFATPSVINKNDCRDLDASNFTELNRCENFSTIHFILMSLSDPDGLLAPLLIFSLVSDFQQTLRAKTPRRWDVYHLPQLHILLRNSFSEHISTLDHGSCNASCLMYIVSSSRFMEQSMCHQLVHCQISK